MGIIYKSHTELPQSQLRLHHDGVTKMT